MCMKCGVTMPADEYCECLKQVGREIRRKARETWDDNRKTRKSKGSANDDTGRDTKPPLLF